MPEILMHSYNKRNVEIQKKTKTILRNDLKKALQLKILASSKKKSLQRKYKTKNTI